MLLLPWLLVAVIWFFPQIHPSDKPAPLATPLDGYDQKARPGPWGELQYSRIVIEPPDEFTASDYATSAPPRWTFVGYSPSQLSALWRSVNLSAAEIAVLENPAHLQLGDGKIVVQPTDDLVLNLGNAARARIYAVLSAFPENPSQNEPFRFRADNADEWFANSKLAPETLALVKRLLYRRGASLLFSDHDVVLPRLPSSFERVKLVKTLARKSTLLVKLRVRPDTDIDTLEAYWGGGPRRKGLRALLESISHRPEGMTIDLAHLLPRFARAHLFTYPQEPTEGDGHDCHWTSMNFFADPPEERFTDTSVVKQTLEQDYAPVVGRPRLGDVFVFMRADGTVIHSCVYIADDIVFTKNGTSTIMPWILMNLSDVIAYYPADPPPTIRAYRRKDI